MAVHASTEKYRTMQGFPDDDIWNDTGAFTQLYYANGKSLISSGAGKYHLPILGG